MIQNAGLVLKLLVDIGIEKRTIVSGIAEHFKPEDIIGTNVSVLVNLAPRKLKGIESNGIHSNGYSLARKALFDDAGFSIDDKMPNCDTTIGEELIRPTELYVKPIVALFKEEYDIHGLAHITGGGFTNLRRLKKGVGYDIYDLPEAPEIFKLIYQQRIFLFVNCILYTLTQVVHFAQMLCPCFVNKIEYR